MRTKKQIIQEYLRLLNEEENLGHTEEEIILKAEDEELVKRLWNVILDEELYLTTRIGAQEVSIERAFYIWCRVIIHKDFKTGDEVWNGFVKKQFNLVEFNKLVVFMAARGHGKTFFLALYVIFKMFNLPYFDVGYCSNIPRQRKRFLRLTQSIIDMNELLLEKKDIGGVANKKIPWGTEDMEYNLGTLEGTTVGTTPRGGHYNLAIGDDPLRDDKKYTYEFIVNYFQGVYKQTILHKKGRYVIVGTPQDPEDLFHVLMNDKLDKNNRPLGKMRVGKISAAGFYAEIFPGILNNETKEVLVPEIFTYEELMAEKGYIGEIRFNREILCQCVTYKNALVSASLFRSCCDENYQMLQKGELDEDGKKKKYVMFIDSATSDAPTADYVAMSVWEDDRKANKFIFRYLFHDKGFPITDPDGGTNDQIHEAARIHRDFHNAMLIVEKNNAGIALIQGIRGQGIEVTEHYTHEGSMTKEGRSDDIISYIEQGLKTEMIIFPADPEDNYTIDTLEKIKGEHLNFGVKKTRTGEKYEAIAGKDDIFDSCWGAFKYRGDMPDTLPFGITFSPSI